MHQAWFDVLFFKFEFLTPNDILRYCSVMQLWSWTGQNVISAKIFCEQMLHTLKWVAHNVQFMYVFVNVPTLSLPRLLLLQFDN